MKSGYPQANAESDPHNRGDPIGGVRGNNFGNHLLGSMSAMSAYPCRSQNSGNLPSTAKHRACRYVSTTAPTIGGSTAIHPA